MPAVPESVWCPRCGDALVPVPEPGTGPRWACARHGHVPALSGFTDPSVHGLLTHLAAATVPIWLPWPMPRAWFVSGCGRAEDRKTVATVLALSGTDALGVAGDLVLVAEDPGVGLGARYAGLEAPDPGPVVDARPADARVTVGGHPTPLWFVEAADDRQVCVGEASGRWLWVVAWPPLASAAVLLEAPVLVDLHDLVGELELVPLTGMSPRLGTRPDG